MEPETQPDGRREAAEALTGWVQNYEWFADGTPTEAFHDAENCLSPARRLMTPMRRPLRSTARAQFLRIDGHDGL